MFASRRPRRDVQGLGSPEIARQAQDGNALELGIQLRAFVMGTAIYHQDFDQRPIVRSFERGQAAAQRGGAVIGKNESRDFRRRRLFFLNGARFRYRLNDGRFLPDFCSSLGGDWHFLREGLHQPVASEQDHLRGSRFERNGEWGWVAGGGEPVDVFLGSRLN